MKSIPRSSARRASARQSGQLADHRSGTLVAERPDEQFAPNTPIFSALPLYMAMRSASAPVRASTAVSLVADAVGGQDGLRCRVLQWRSAASLTRRSRGLESRP